MRKIEVREVIAALRRARKIVEPGGISMKDQLQQLVEQMHSTGILYSEAVREFKRRFVQQVLDQNKGNQCRAASELGMHRNTLARLRSELQMHTPRKRASSQGPAASATQVSA